MNDLITGVDKIHTTELGVLRIKRNLKLDESTDVVTYCKNIVLNDKALFNRKGKNWYVDYDALILTINAHSYTIITAHMKKK